MSDFLRVTCACGCENRVPADHRSASAHCVMCGHELQITDTLVAERDIPSSYSSLLDSLPLAPSSASSVFEDDPVPIVSKSAYRFTTYAPPAHERMGEFCARCGNELRGTWDRLETPKGPLCYICANQAVDGTPERLKQQAAVDTEDDAPRTRRVRFVGSAQPSWWGKNRSRIGKVMIALFVGLFFVAVFALTVLDLDRLVPIQSWDAPSGPSVIDINKLTIVPWALYQGWKLVSVTVPIFFGVYFSLLINNSLPHERLIDNLLYSAACCVPLVIVRIIGIMGAITYGGDARGILILLLAAVAQALAIIFIAFDMLDDGFQQAACFVAIAVCVFVAMPYLNGLVFQGLSAL